MLNIWYSSNFQLLSMSISFLEKDGIFFFFFEGGIFI